MLKKFFKKENASITLFVLVAMLFFLIIILGMYMASNNRNQAQISEIDKIKDEYDKDVDNLDGIYNEALDFSDLLKAGDMVEYNTGNPDVGDNGVIDCIVLYDKTYNEENGTNYGIQIIAADTVGDDVTLGSSDFNTATNSYNTAITTLNAKAEEYLNTTYASDARCVGSVPNNKNSEATDYFTIYYGHSGISFRNTDTNYKTDYEQIGSDNLNIANIGKSYWLASRIINYYENHGGYTYSCMRGIGTSGYLSENNLCYVYASNSFNGYSVSLGFRPVFTLKSDIKISGGDGSKTVPYTLAP